MRTARDLTKRKKEADGRKKLRPLTEEERAILYKEKPEQPISRRVNRLAQVGANVIYWREHTSRKDQDKVSHVFPALSPFWQNEFNGIFRKWGSE